MRGTDQGTYMRIVLSLIAGNPRPKPFTRFDGVKLHTGTQSLHRTPQSRRWRLFLRIKRNRYE